MPEGPIRTTVSDDDPEGLVLAAIERCFENGWTDGLPVVPPLPRLVDALLAETARDPDEIIWTMSQVRRSCTVRLAAVNAAMAGCRPEYFPVVLAALEATIDEGWPGMGAWQSTTGGGPLHVVNGPVRTELGFNCTGNVFGPGFRPNATVGRAIRLVILNVFDLRPHVLDQSTQGTSGKYTLCIGENEEDSPWEPIHVELGAAPGTSMVSAMHVRSVECVDHRHSAEPAHLLNDLALTISRNAGGPRGHKRAAVILGPEHAHLLARRGMSKQDVKEHLAERVGQTRGQLRSMGRRPPGRHGPDGSGGAGAAGGPGGPDGLGELAPPGMFSEASRAGYGDGVGDGVGDGLDDGLDDELVRWVHTPDDLLVVVSGANNAGVSAVAHPLGIATRLPGRAVVAPRRRSAPAAT